MKRLARYLAGTKDFVSVLNKSGVRDLKVTTDSNWAGCRRTRKSTPCLVIKVGNSTLCAASRTQTVLAQSSGEA